MGLSPTPSGNGLAKAVMQSLLKEACELVAFNSPGVNAWARERLFSNHDRSARRRTAHKRTASSGWSYSSARPSTIFHSPPGLESDRNDPRYQGVVLLVWNPSLSSPHEFFDWKF